jgi:hypothetical protein
MKFLSVIAALLLTTGAVAQSCDIFNTDAGGSNTLLVVPNGNYHATGEHWGQFWHNGSCTYQTIDGSQVGSPCEADLFLSDTPTYGEEGSVNGFHHELNSTSATASVSSLGSPSATAQAAVGVAACPGTVCNFTVSLGGVVSIGSSTGFAVWGHGDSYSSYCPSHVLGCPIIIDTAHEGFQLTDARDGVDTDMVIPGHKMRFAWTKQGSRNAFLWLDDHLFGNSTPQPSSDDPNGFAALAVYDSNGDGVIDDKDPVFSRLRLWIDANHDGVAQPEELHTLPELGVYAINLAHEVDKYYDANGNLYHYRGSLKTAAKDVDHTIYDVYFATDVRQRPSGNIKDTLR